MADVSLHSFSPLCSVSDLYIIYCLTSRIPGEEVDELVQAANSKVCDMQTDFIEGLSPT